MSKTPLPPDDAHALDAALAAPLLDVPDDFAARVMAALPAPRAEATAVARSGRLARALKTVALALGAAAGLAQALAFAASLWAATTVGG